MTRHVVLSLPPTAHRQKSEFIYNKNNDKTITITAPCLEIVLQISTTVYSQQKHFHYDSLYKG